MNLGLVLSIICLIYIILITSIYYSKQRIKLLENKIYEAILLSTLIGLFISIIGFIVDINYSYFLNLRYLLSKLYYVYLLTFMFLLTLYIIFSSISHDLSEKILREKPKSIISIIATIYLCLLTTNLLLPFQYMEENNTIYLTGPNTIFIYVICALSILFWIVYIAINFRKLKRRKYIPILAFILVGIPVIYVQFNFPELLLETSLITFVIVFMYFTIENPDVQLLGEMQLARDEAEKANRAKTDFLSSMSHEIRTPLNAIKGFSEITEEAKSIEEAKENAKEVVKASNVLLEIVNGVLDISRIESGNMQIINSDYKPSDLFKDVIKTINYRFEQKDLEFKVSIAEDIPSCLYGDYINIKKVITNLLTNAVKYTDDGAVTFTVNCINKGEVCRLLIAVEDTGRGIKPENIDKLFTKFNRLDEDRNTTTEGTGLGLAITKQILELMGGEITVQSVYGGGSKFSVAINQRIKTSSCVMPEVLREAQREQVTAQVSTQLTDYSNKKVLIIDDNKLNIKIASKFLESTKCQIYEALSAKETLDRVANGETFDLILADDMMPNMDGTSMMRELKQKGYPKPIVVLTANVMDGEKERYLSCGFDDYLGKPINKKELERVLNRFLN